jgi:hypothetical protein
MSAARTAAGFMPAAGGAGWDEANLQFLRAAIGSARASLIAWMSAQGAPGVPQPPARAEVERALSEAREWLRATGREESSLDRLQRLFSLSGFERDVLLCCAAVELDPLFASLCRSATREEQPGMTSQLAIDFLPGAHWTAFTPGSPLRHWSLVEVAAGPTLTRSLLRIDERILHELVGASCVDSRVANLASPLAALAMPPESLPESLKDACARFAGEWVDGGSKPPACMLSGGDAELRAAAAAAAFAMAGLGAWSIAVALLPARAEEAEALARLWEREAALGKLGLLVELGDNEASEWLRNPGWLRFVETLRTPVVIGAGFRCALPARRTVAREVPQAAFAGAGGTAASESARLGARQSLDELAQRIEVRPAWDDLVLPARQKDVLRQIAGQVENRRLVYQEWGFASRANRGLGITALFAGPSGTGKTMAAEVIARELNLDLYRVDLSAVTSKYIGETEKNLRRTFDAAERCGAILLFDEADALFGPRSEVRDSHDRHANIEVSYLLQRMETYSGLAILTTNRREALDHAFLRRLRFIVEFPFPSPAERGEIWRCIFPCETPLGDLDHGLLGRLELSGGSIRNVALNAAFLAASDHAPVGMTHIARAARAELQKLELPVSAADALMAGQGVRP